MRPLVTLTLVSLLALLGCEFSTTKLPASPAELRVEVDVERRSERRGSARHVDETGDIRAILRNRKGTAIESADIKLLVNGVPLRFLVGQGNYYDRHAAAPLARPVRAP